MTWESTVNAYKKDVERMQRKEVVEGKLQREGITYTSTQTETSELEDDPQIPLHEPEPGAHSPYTASSKPSDSHLYPDQVYIYIYYIIGRGNEGRARELPGLFKGYRFS